MQEPLYYQRGFKNKLFGVQRIVACTLQISFHEVDWTFIRYQEECCTVFHMKSFVIEVLYTGNAYSGDEVRHQCTYAPRLLQWRSLLQHIFIINLHGLKSRKLNCFCLNGTFFRCSCSPMASPCLIMICGLQSCFLLTTGSVLALWSVLDNPSVVSCI